MEVWYRDWYTHTWCKKNKWNVSKKYIIELGDSANITITIGDAKNITIVQISQKFDLYSINLVL